MSMGRQGSVASPYSNDSSTTWRSAAEDTEASAAWTTLQAERAASANRLQENLEGIFPWLLAQDQTTILQLLTFVVTVSVTGIYGTEPDRQSNDAQARALGLDMSKW